MENKKKEEKKNETWYPFRSLANYKIQHAKTAEAKGVKEKFLAAPTLTAARRLVFGNGK